MLPTPSQAKNDTSNSINQIVLRLEKYLKRYNWQITENLEEADIVAVHAGQSTIDMPCDVAHCHGLYPTGLFPNTSWHYHANANVIRTLKEAKRITVPSAWVAEIIKRDMNIEPEIVNWAIDRSEWYQGAHQSYTLWNKTRIDAVCDPTPMYYLADKIKDAKFVTTYKPDGKKDLPNLQVTGRMKFDEMREVILNASVYLATTKETFGIGILEAMACGTPILGYNWGAVPDYVTHGHNGYLVEPGDLEGLVTGWRWIMRYRRTLSWNARQTAIDDFFLWDRVAQHIADIYDDVLQEKVGKYGNPDISVIIPNHNYEAYLSEAVLSVFRQETKRQIEIIVLNDKCEKAPDDLLNELNRNHFKNNITLDWVNVDFGSVAKTRNHGIQLSHGNYIMCLDADDQLASATVLDTLANALDNNSDLSIAYGKLAVFKDSLSENGAMVSGFPDNYVPDNQIEGRNQIPSCCLFRREAYNATGGYRQHLEPAEDAGLWTQMALYGYRGELVTQEVTTFYRMHDKSLSHPVRTQQKAHPKYWELHGSHKSKRYPFPCVIIPKKHPSHPVYNYDSPEVSVIIPVGKGHENHAIRAVDSVSGQTFWNWECIVINDTGRELSLPQTWATVIGTSGAKGSGYARNLGTRFARGTYVVYLDADDKLEPDYIEKTLILAKATSRYVYTDWYRADRTVHKAENYRQSDILNMIGIHAVTMLIKRDTVLELGGFDESLTAWEDADLIMRLAIEGYCGQHLPEALFEYDYESGFRREFGVTNKDALLDVIKSKHGDYMSRKIEPMCCGKGVNPAKPVADSIPPDESVEVMIVDGPEGAMPIVGTVTKTRYGHRSKGDVFQMYASDARAFPDRFKAVNREETIAKTEEPKPPVEMDAFPFETIKVDYLENFATDRLLKFKDENGLPNVITQILWVHLGEFTDIDSALATIRAQFGDIEAGEVETEKDYTVSFYYVYSSENKDNGTRFRIRELVKSEVITE